MKKKMKQRIKAAAIAYKKKAAAAARKELAAAKKRFNAAHKRANMYVKSNPEKAVLAAAALGAAIGVAATAVALRKRK